MDTERRNFMLAGAATVAAIAAPQLSVGQPRSVAAPRAIAFDEFPILDPRPIGVACERAYPGRGKELLALWRMRQFEYQWLRALGGRYVDFWQATSDALIHACESLGLSASPGVREKLMQEFLQLDVWPDVPDALRTLKQRGLSIAFLSNATTPILEGAIRRAGIASLFDHVISTDRVRAYKPDPRAYQLGIEVLRKRREEILFVAFAGWDVAGAKWFGYRTFWNNRLNAAPEQLDVQPDASGATLDALVRHLDGEKKMGWPMGLEPTTAEITTRGSTN
jgi:2-haloacid dehalogenase